MCHFLIPCISDHLLCISSPKNTHLSSHSLCAQETGHGVSGSSTWCFSQAVTKVSARATVISGFKWGRISFHAVSMTVDRLAIIGWWPEVTISSMPESLPPSKHREKRGETEVMVSEVTSITLCHLLSILPQRCSSDLYPIPSLHSPSGLVTAFRAQCLPSSPLYNDSVVDQLRAKL